MESGYAKLAELACDREPQTFHRINSSTQRNRRVGAQDKLGFVSIWPAI